MTQSFPSAATTSSRAPEEPMLKRHPLSTARGAYAMAWSVWFAYLVIPLFVFLGVVVYVLSSGGSSSIDGGRTWFFAMIFWLGAVVPFSFLLQSRFFFHDYWHGRPVSPRNYFWGMTLTWTTIELAGIISLIGCAVSHNMAPCIIPAFIAFLLFVTQWPDGSAMTGSTGNEVDSGTFKFPR